MNMIDTLLEKKLKKMKGDVLFIVMDDGVVFSGTLKDFDKQTILMTDVKQASATEIQWKEVGEEELEEEPYLKNEEEGKFGYVPWKDVILDEVYIRIEHISRIWPVPHTEKGTEEETAVSHRPLYKEHSVPNISAGLEIPEDRISKR